MKSALQKKHIAGYYARKLMSKLLLRSPDLVSMFRQGPAGPGNDTPRYIIRVDDFPHWKHSPGEFGKFHRVMRDNGLHYLLGVIPFPGVYLSGGYGGERGLEPDEKEMILKIRGEGAEIAMHGFSHARTGKVKSELVGMNEEELEKSIRLGLEVFRKMDIRPEVFIPPFNTVDMNGIRVLGRYFKAVTGGEETIKYLGFLWGIARVENIMYIPSYPPLYQKAADICEYLGKTDMREHVCGYAPVTLHWTWEMEDGYRGLEKLAALIRGKTASWREAIEGY
ncbi:MAG: DUF2334 domain-containing protein [Elusimicrobia bacterium]|nr:DUF2334 domain-containing protein [Elusimicrobiota bacterium]